VKIWLIVLMIIMGSKIWASGVMVRPMKIDPCAMNPEREGCPPSSDEDDKDFDVLEAEPDEPVVKKQKKRRRRKRRRVHPCRRDPEGEACLQWKQRRRKRKKSQIETTRRSTKRLSQDLRRTL